MRILQLCKKFPFPLKDGESIAVTYLGKALHELGCELTLLSMNTSKHFCRLSELPESFDHFKDIIAVPVDNQIRIVDAFLNLFSKESYHISRFISMEFEQKLVGLLKEREFDIIQLETPVLSYYLPLIRKYSDAAVVLRSHNVEHEIWERIADNARFLPLKWYFRQAARKLREYEIRWMNEYDLVLPISERDQATYRNLGLRKPDCVIPIGLETSDYHPDYSVFQQNPLTIGFIGSLDWMPNQEGLRWFLDQVWPDLKQRLPQVELHIAGRNTPKWISDLRHDGLVIHGEVKDARKFINAHPVLIVPLFSGSGMRVKILEGMALGRVVLTTGIGLEGIDADHNEHLLIADGPENYVRELEAFGQNRDAMIELGKRARDFVARKYDHLSIAGKLNRFYRKALLKESGILAPEKV